MTTLHRANTIFSGNPLGSTENVGLPMLVDE